MSVQTKPDWIEADAYLFDIDGTLLNASGRAHYNAFHSALEKMLGVKAKIDGVPLHGNTDIGILRAVTRREGLADSALDERLPELLEHMCAEVERNQEHIRAEACPSIPDLVQLLHARGKLLGVASGNLERIGWLKIQAAGLREYFSFGSFSDRRETRAEIFAWAIEEVKLRLGKNASTCVVGDTPADIEAAQAVGIPVVAVATGIYSVEQLAEGSPDLLVSCCTELLERSA